MLARILMRPTTGGNKARRKRRTGTSVPLMRNSTSNVFWPGRIWMSEARRLTASASKLATSRTMGALRANSSASLQTRISSSSDPVSMSLIASDSSSSESLWDA